MERDLKWPSKFFSSFLSTRDLVVFLVSSKKIKNCFYQYHAQFFQPLKEDHLSIQRQHFGVQTQDRFSVFKETPWGQWQDDAQEILV
jgi:hypothetical protein